MTDRTIPLTLTAEPTTWNGFSAILPPEPQLPQGEYGGPLPTVARKAAKTSTKAVELLSPAGGPDAAFAALHYGADAIYLGLRKFSARAEAENFSVDELSEITAYAHSLTPRRRVFVTINTLIRHDELAELIEMLGKCVELGVDAIILQDLGVYYLIKHHFPSLELHASTQLSVHNRAGAEALRELGFTRVVLARELTAEEVSDITATSGIETEVFIHGALCYAYSGLCLFSSQTLGRSGNRGKCAYSCRDSFNVSGAPQTLRDGTSVKRDPGKGFPFSMKDLALPDHLPELREAGVSCFKIEGRKKSPLYVATTTDYYRRLLDNKIDEPERKDREADLQTVFSRPWTQLFVDSHLDKEVADRDTVGHRGHRIGSVEAIRNVGGQRRLRFRSDRPLEKHDGLQIDLPKLGKPFGFAVETIWIDGKHESFESQAGALLEVPLPADAPQLPIGAPVYCSSSQAVKREYRAPRPKAGLFRVRQPMVVSVSMSSERVVARGQVAGAQVEATLDGPFAPALGEVAAMIRTAFEKLGDTDLMLEKLEVEGACFVPVSKLNALRREIVEKLAAARRKQAPLVVLPAPVKAQARPISWSIKVDRVGWLDALEEADWEGVSECLIDISRDHPTQLFEGVERLAARLGSQRVRLALPALTRKWEEKGLTQKIQRLREKGFSRWEVANLSGWSFLPGKDLDRTTDWSVYVINRYAALQLLEMGATGFTLSPEDGLDNMRPLLAEFGDRATAIVFQDTPLFLAESCAYANLIGGCPGKANCQFESMEMTSSHGEKVLALDYHCRTIVLNQEPYSIADRIADLQAAGAARLRADFVYRPYLPEEVRRIWRLVRQGKPVAGGQAANFDRGVL